MTTYKTCAVSALATAIAVAGPVQLPAEAAPENLPPAVSVTWPTPEDRFSATVVMKIEVSAADADGSIAEVRFFADTNLIGVVTNAPFNLLWEEWVPCGYDNCPFTLTAVAIDNSGAEAVSAPIKLYQYVGGPPRPVLKIRWPPTVRSSLLRPRSPFARSFWRAPAQDRWNFLSAPILWD